MDSYEALAAAYDELTEDVEYEKRADFVEKLFLRAKRPVRSLLDLACGTGTMTELFARRGYTVTGVDYSPEMLAQAQQKLATLDRPPPLLCQSMPQLRAAWTSVDAAICCLDSINYLTRPRDVQRTFARLHDAIAPGGSLVFDVHAVSKFGKARRRGAARRARGRVLPLAHALQKRQMLDYEVDLFRLQLDGAWERDFQEHHQRAYTVEELTAWLEEAGFTAIRTHGELKLRRANERDGRIYFSCIRK